MPDKESGAVYRVVVEQAAEQPLAVAKDRASARTMSAKWEKLSRSVWEFLGKHPGLRVDGHNVMVYHDSGDLGGFGRGEQIPIEVGVQVARRFDGAGSVECSSTPSGMVATTLHVGPYEGLSTGHSAGRQWRRENHRVITGLNWEVYGDWSHDQ